MTSFLFLIVAKGLAGFIRQTTKKQLYQGVKIGTRRVAVNSLQFANNTLLLLDIKV